MNYFKKAQAVLDETERQLRDLIAHAATNSHYDDLSAIAQIARAIALLRESANAPTGNLVIKSRELAKPQVEGRTKQIVTDAHQLSVGTRHAEFPRFEIDGKRLVKIGWSPRDKCVYEHRVERELVNSICDRLTQKATSRKPFKMEKLFPMQSADDTEIPSYKAYLVLKWLQHFNIIERKGKDGYIFVDKDFAADAVEDLWKRTPQRNGLKERGTSIE